MKTIIAPAVWQLWFFSGKWVYVNLFFWWAIEW